MTPTVLSFEFMNALGLFQMIGFLGFLFYVYAFAALQLEWLNGNGIGYCVLNIIAAVLVSVSLIAEFNLASALIQGSWIIIGCVGLCRQCLVKEKNAVKRSVAGFITTGV